MRSKESYFDLKGGRVLLRDGNLVILAFLEVSDRNLGILLDYFFRDWFREGHLERLFLLSADLALGRDGSVELRDSVRQVGFAAARLGVCEESGVARLDAVVVGLRAEVGVGAEVAILHVAERAFIAVLHAGAASLRVVVGPGTV